jgi:hypothetical protein
MLMAMYGIDFDSGEDIPQQGRSYFLDLLQQGQHSLINPSFTDPSDNEELLEQFINEEEPKFFNKEKRNKRKRGEEAEEAQFEPEDAFLKISSSLRQVQCRRPARACGPPRFNHPPPPGPEAPAAAGDAAGDRGPAAPDLLPRPPLRVGRPLPPPGRRQVCGRGPLQL